MESFQISYSEIGYSNMLRTHLIFIIGCENCDRNKKYLFQAIMALNVFILKSDLQY